MSVPLQVTGLTWLGVRTPRHEAQALFLEQVLGLVPGHHEPGMTAYDLADGSQLELFSPQFVGKDHFTTGPVAGFGVRDLDAARAHLVGHGVELLGEPGPGWQHFRAPDGHVYELKRVEP